VKERFKRFFRAMSPGLALLFLAPVMGELVSGHANPLEFFVPPIFALIALPYGCGALICRELMRRWGKGWPSLLLLSLAFGIWEEGVVVRSFFDPEWGELGVLADYQYAYNINWTYSLSLIHFHITISILAGITVAEMLYPARRRDPWLTNRQLGLCFLVMALWPFPFWLITDYMPPPAYYGLTFVVVFGLIGLARISPARFGVREQAPHPSDVPPPRRFLLLGGINMWVFFIAVFMLPDAGIKPPLALMVVALIALDVVSLVLAVRWSGSARAWDDRHRLALVLGWLSFFIVFGALQDFDTGFAGHIFVAAAAVYYLRKLKAVIEAREAPGGAERPQPAVL
jgi:hypothetical protein